MPALHNARAIASSRVSHSPLQLLDKDSGWVVAYHGTRATPKIIASIVREGFKARATPSPMAHQPLFQPVFRPAPLLPSRLLQIRGGATAPLNGAAHGTGVYCSPTVEYAKEYPQAGWRRKALLKAGTRDLAGHPHCCSFH